MLEAAGAFGQHRRTENWLSVASDRVDAELACIREHAQGSRSGRSARRDVRRAEGDIASRTAQDGTHTTHSWRKAVEQWRGCATVQYSKPPDTPGAALETHGGAPGSASGGGGGGPGAGVGAGTGGGAGSTSTGGMAGGSMPPYSSGGAYVP